MNMQKNIFSLALGLALLLAVTSCSKFLEVTPKSVASEQAFYKTRQDAIVATNACYNTLIDMYRGPLWLFTEVQADDAGDPDVAIDNLTYDATNSTVDDLWRLHYQGIARCNTLLERIGGISMDAELKKRLQLEARYLRAYYYFNLVRFFGDVPLSVTEVRNIESSLPGRVPATEVYTQIIADLTAAQELPVTYAASDVGRITRGAAKALLVKVYLTQRNWPLAAAKAREIIESGSYRLLPNYADNFLVTNRNSAESIFEIQFARGGQTGTGSPVVSYFFEQFAPGGSADIVTGIVGSNGQGRLVPTNDLVTAYEPGDLRRPGSLRTFYVRTTGNRSDTVRVNFTTKYLDPQATAGGASGQGSENGWRVIRYTDVLLMYAEALNEQGGGNAVAFEVVNQVRRRARGSNASVLPDLRDLNQVALREAIARERRVELAFEGHRWFDLIRTGRVIPVMSQTKTIQERNLLLPIPQRERDLNVNLRQNQGY